MVQDPMAVEASTEAEEAEVEEEEGAACKEEEGEHGSTVLSQMEGSSLSVMERELRLIQMDISLTIYSIG